MAKIQKEILDSFFTKLGDLETVEQHMIDGLRELLSSGSMPKPDEIVNVFSADANLSSKQ